MSESVVLYIEDEEMIFRMVGVLLSKSLAPVYRLLWADTLAKALPILEEQEVSVILLDLNLPDSRGIDTLDRVRAAAPLHPLVVITGQTDDSNVDQILSHGAQEFLPKTELTVSALLRVLRFAQERKRGETRMLNDQQRLEKLVQDRTRDLEKANQRLRDHIEQRQRIMESLRQREEESRALLEGIPIPMAVYDDQGHLLFVNPAFIQTFRWAREELIGHKLDFVPADALHQLPARIEQMKRGEKVIPFETVRLTKDGQRLDVVISTAPLQNGLGSHIGNIVVFHDITDLKRAEQARAESEHRYQMLVETMSEGLVEVDPDLRLVYHNQSFARMLGYDADDPLSFKYLFDLMNESSRQVMASQWEKRKKGVESSYEVAWRKRDGGLAFSLVSGKPRFDEKGNFLGSIALITSITERKILEGQLLQAQKLEAIGQLAAGIAHEINTPTQYVSDNTRFLRESFADFTRAISSYMALAQRVKQTHCDDPALAQALAEAEGTYQGIDGDYLLEEVPKAIEQTQEGLSRISTIVRSMKEFAHPGPDTKNPTDLNRAIQNTITVAKNEWKYVAELVTDLDPDLPLVPCVLGQINQVILNIIVNAAQAIAETCQEGQDPKGEIRISTRQVGEAVEVRIADTGPGIPETVRGHVFDPFFTTKPPGKGTGQGLAIAYRVVVDKHGGQLDFSSQEGQGATFVITLPLQDSEKEKPRP
jgi:PAS domain S-box-containing protein